MYVKLHEQVFVFFAGFPLQAPLVYHYGHLSPGPNEKLYNKISSKIAEVTKERFEKNKKGEPRCFPSDSHVPVHVLFVCCV